MNWELLKKIREEVGRNIGLFLVIFNTFLAALLFIQYNPLGILKSGYEGASLLLDLQQESVRSIEIKDPDFRDVVVRLVREDKLPVSQWTKSEEGEEKSFFDKIYESTPTQFRWRMEPIVKKRAENSAESTESANESVDVDGAALSEKSSEKSSQEKSSPEQSSEEKNSQEQSSEEKSSSGQILEEKMYAVDAERIAEFFAGLQDTRRYYAVERTEEKEKELEMIRDSKGDYACLHMRFLLENGQEHSILVGNRRAGSESYVRLDEEQNIYLVTPNLRSLAGGGTASYFRDRLIFSPEIEKKNVAGFSLKRLSGENIVRMSRKGDQWNMQIPPAAGQTASVNVDAFISDIFGWRSRDFPQSEPDDLDRRFASVFTLRYNEKENLTSMKEFSLQIVGRRGVSDYVVKLPSGSLREITSVALEDVFDPIKNFTEKSQR